MEDQTQFKKVHTCKTIEPAHQLALVGSLVMYLSGAYYQDWQKSIQMYDWKSNTKSELPLETIPSNLVVGNNARYFACYQQGYENGTIPIFDLETLQKITDFSIGGYDYNKEWPQYILLERDHFLGFSENDSQIIFSDKKRNLTKIFDIRSKKEVRELKQGYDLIDDKGENGLSKLGNGKFCLSSLGGSDNGFEFTVPPDEVFFATSRDLSCVIGLTSEWKNLNIVNTHQQTQTEKHWDCSSAFCSPSALSPDTRSFVIGQFKNLQFCNLYNCSFNSFKEPSQIALSGDLPTALAFDKDGHYLVASGLQKSEKKDGFLDVFKLKKSSEDILGEFERIEYQKDEGCSIQ